MDYNALLSSLKTEALVEADKSRPSDLIEIVQEAYDLGRDKGREESFQEISKNIPYLLRQSKDNLPTTNTRDSIRLDDPISVLDLPPRLYSTLADRWHNVRTIRSLVALTKSDLLGMYGIGDRFVETIENSLSVTNYRLKS